MCRSLFVADAGGVPLPLDPNLDTTSLVFFGDYECRSDGITTCSGIECGMEVHARIGCAAAVPWFGLRPWLVCLRRHGTAIFGLGTLQGEDLGIVVHWLATFAEGRYLGRSQRLGIAASCDISLRQDQHTDSEHNGNGRVADRDLFFGVVHLQC